MFYSTSFSLFLFAYLASLSSTQQQPPTYIYHICPNTTTYPKNSTYSSNLRNLLFSLSSNNNFFSTGFRNTVAGQSPDEVYGLFLCRGDLSPEVCRGCVDFAANDTLSRCPAEKEAVIYYDECMLRYADQNFFLDSRPVENGTNGIILLNTQNITTNQTGFRALVLSTMNQTATEAENSRKFAARNARWTEFQDLYVLVQCIPDLPSQGCLNCLQQINNQLPVDKVGGRLIVPSCSSRFELYQFYNESAVGTPQPQLDASPPLPPPPIPIPSPPPGEGRNSSVIIIAVVIPVTVFFLLLLAFFSFRAKRKRVVYETEPLARDGDDITTAGSLQFDFKAIEAATDNFSESNKLGQGGFGQVYK